MNYQLIDVQGKIALSGEITDAITTFDLSLFGKGTYFIKVIKESNEIKTFKIIKN